MRIKVNVTQQNIKKGQRERSNACPVYYALREAGLKRGIDVYGDAFSIPYKTYGFTHWQQIDLPSKTTAFIRNFDLGRPVKPFTFFVRVPDQYLVKPKN